MYHGMGGYKEKAGAEETIVEQRPDTATGSATNEYLEASIPFSLKRVASPANVEKSGACNAGRKCDELRELRCGILKARLLVGGVEEDITSVVTQAMIYQLLYRATLSNRDDELAENPTHRSEKNK